MKERLLQGLLAAGLVVIMLPGVTAARSSSAADVIIPPDGVECGVYANVTLRDGSSWIATLAGGHRQQVITKKGLVEGKCVFRPATYVVGSPPPEVVRVRYVDGEGLVVHVVITPTGTAHYTYRGIPTS